MKKMLIILIIVLVGLVGYKFYNYYKNYNSRSREKITTLKVGSRLLRVETAKTSEEVEKGLSGRKSLCEDCGMLFIFKRPDFYTFWMREMYFDIDIIWIAKDEVVDITFGAKKPSIEDFENPKTTYFPNQPADKVLEVNAGWAEKNGIKRGDKVIFLTDLKTILGEAVKVRSLSDNPEMFLVTIGVCENHRRTFEDLSEAAKNDRYCFLLQNIRDWIDCQVNQKKLF